VTGTVDSVPGRVAERDPRSVDLRCEDVGEPVITTRWQTRLATAWSILGVRFVVWRIHNIVRAVVSHLVRARRLVALAGGHLGVGDGRLLVFAAGRLPDITGTGPVLSSDVHTSLFVAACRLGFGGTARAHRAADRAEAVLAHDLISRGELSPDAPTNRRLHGWLMHQSVSTVAQALYSAAGRQGHDGHGPDPGSLRPPGLPGRWLSRHRWPGLRRVEAPR